MSAVTGSLIAKTYPGALLIAGFFLVSAIFLSAQGTSSSPVPSLPVTEQTVSPNSNQTISPQALPAAQMPVTQAALTPASGSISNGSYINAYFKFSYRLPEQWQSHAQANPFESGGYREESASSEIHQDGSKKYLLLQEGEGATGNSVQVVAYDASEEPGITSEDVVLAELGALRSLGGTVEGSAAEKTIDGRIFSVGKTELRGEVRGQNQIVYAGVAAVKHGNFVLAWSFFADSPGRLEQLLGTLDTISFEK
jgi:hypothetical protein